MRIHDAYTKLDRPTAADGAAAPTGDAAVFAASATGSLVLSGRFCPAMHGYDDRYDEANPHW